VGRIWRRKPTWGHVQAHHCDPRIPGTVLTSGEDRMAVRSTSEPLSEPLNVALKSSHVAGHVSSTLDSGSRGRKRVHRCTSRLGIILVRSRKDSQQASNDIAVENHRTLRQIQPRRSRGGMLGSSVFVRTLARVQFFRNLNDGRRKLRAFPGLRQ